MSMKERHFLFQYCTVIECIAISPKYLPVLNTFGVSSGSTLVVYLIQPTLGICFLQMNVSIKAIVEADLSE